MVFIFLLQEQSPATIFITIISLNHVNTLISIRVIFFYFRPHFSSFKQNVVIRHFFIKYIIPKFLRQITP